MCFGEQMVQIRTQLGMSQAELAAILHVHQSTISRYECNQGVPDMNGLLQLSRLMGISLEELVAKYLDKG